jgi:hypothetical protein
LAPPIAALTQLEPGWDGEQAECPSAELISRAQEFWDVLTSKHFIHFEAPLIFPGREEVIAYTWSHPSGRRLDIWIRTPDEQLFADWSLCMGSNLPTKCGDAKEATDLLDVVYQYLFQ